MPRRKIRAHYEHMSEFETGRDIGLKEAGVEFTVARSLYCSPQYSIHLECGSATTYLVFSCMSREMSRDSPLVPSPEKKSYTSINPSIRKKYFCEIQEKLNNTYDSSEFWKTIARFRKRNYTQGNISISDWQQLYNKLLDTESIPDYEPVTMTFLNTDNELTKCITLNEISKEISRIRHGKATGFDDIMNEAIKALPKDYLISLKDIFNRILRTSEFPTTWLKSVIQPILRMVIQTTPLIIEALRS
ncbi:hypothetical protein LAZ67_5002533 [Cordylochernes scorpioides]|uniref:Reverse transcriptase n=1 Tax=Cordylochernes scorpioides TaxID=51811 RepID=A0ABY6KGH7_9ARAC|nr:hypothetical protein LAZ67_5002533 [Cordylochernes scorpioides]